jgi:hypothetical protein
LSLWSNPGLKLANAFGVIQTDALNFHFEEKKLFAALQADDRDKILAALNEQAKLP